MKKQHYISSYVSAFLQYYYIRKTLTMANTGHCIMVPY